MKYKIKQNMPGISASKVCVPFHQRVSGAFVTSAIVTAANPDKIVITFSVGIDGSALPAGTAFTITPSRTVTAISVVSGALVLTVDKPFEIGEAVTVQYTRPGTNNLKDENGEDINDFTTPVTNNSVYYSWKLEPTGNGSGVSTLRLQTSANITATITGDADFYTDAAGTTGQSKSWSITSGALRTIYLKCTNTATIVFSDGSKITRWGDASGDGWTSAANAAKVSVTLTHLPLSNLRITGNSTIIGAIPSGMTGMLSLNGDNINWTYTGALPSGVTGALYLNGSNINWTYTGALPSGLTNLYLNGSNINWTYTGALPSGVTGVLYFDGNNINWTYTGALPSGLTYLFLSGNNINWTGLDPAGGNITYFNLANFRIAKISSADMVTFLTNLTNRAGTLPATITINDFQDYASPPQAVIDAVNLLKSTKSVTTVNLGA